MRRLLLVLLLVSCAAPPAVASAPPPSLTPPPTAAVAPAIELDDTPTVPFVPLATPRAPVVAPTVRGLYVTGWVASDPERRRALFALGRTAGLNAVVIDVKDSSGRLFLDEAADAVADAHAVSLYAIARVVCFEDPVLAAAHPELAFTAGGRLWRGESGLPWVDVRKGPVRRYVAGVAASAARAGFDEIQLDYLRFPTGDAVDALDRGTEETRVAAIATMLDDVRAALPQSVLLSADVFGLTTTAVDDMTIGQDLVSVAAHADVVSPMMYPSHYAPYSYGLADPDAAPREVIDAGLRDALDKLSGRAAKLRPWLQAFSLRHSYGPAQIRAQVEAALGRGVTSFLLWDPANRYDALPR